MGNRTIHFNLLFLYMVQRM